MAPPDDRGDVASYRWPFDLVLLTKKGACLCANRPIGARRDGKRRIARIRYPVQYEWATELVSHFPTVLATFDFADLGIYCKESTAILERAGDQVMADASTPPTPPSGDFSDHWGFYLLQTLNQGQAETRRELQAVRDDMSALRSDLDRMRREVDQKIDTLESKMDQKIDALESKMDQKIDTLESKMDQKIDALDTKFDLRLDHLRYWAWASLLAVILAAGTLLLTHA